MYPTLPRWWLVCGLPLVLIATALNTQLAVASPFSGANQFVGKSVVPDSNDQHFFAGAHFQVAPVKAVIQSVVKKKVNDYAAQNPGAAQMVQYMQYVDAKQVKQFADSGQVEQYKAELKKQLAAQGQTLTADQTAQINAIDSSKLKMLATVVQMYQEPEPTTTFSLEPYAGFIAGPLMVTAQVPIAGFHTSAQDTMVLGNPGLDVRLGQHFGLQGAAFAYAVGASGWAPLGSEDSSTIVLSNVLASPRYMHDYASWTGYGVLAAELAVFDLQVRGEYVEMRPSSSLNSDSNPLNDLHLMRYVNAGAALSTDMGFVGLSLAVDGLFNVKNAPAYNNTYFVTAGMRLFLKKAQIGAAIQLPLAKPGDGDTVPVGGINLGSPASVNMLLNAQINL